MAANPKKRWIRWLAIAAALYLVGVAAVLVLRLSVHPDWNSSPTETRDVYQFKEGRLGILEPARQRRASDRPASAVMRTPVLVPGKASDFLLDWNDPAVGDEEGDSTSSASLAREAGVQPEEQPDRWAPGLLGDDKLELVAFASWVPGAGDDLAAGDGWQAEPGFYEAKTGEKLGAEDLDEMGVPADFRKLTPPREYPTPKIRLLFRSSGMEYLNFPRAEGGDRRTDAVVTYDLDSLGEDELNYEARGEWSRLDMALLIWHDTPLRFHVQVLTGEPQVEELKQELGEQVFFGDRLRVQWLGKHDGAIYKETISAFEPAASVAPETLKRYRRATPSDVEPPGVLPPGLSNPFGSGRIAPGNVDPASFEAGPFALRLEVRQPEWNWRPLTLIRSSSEDYLEHHCGFLREDGSVAWHWDDESSVDGIELYSIMEQVPDDRPVRLVFLPSVTELTFEIPGLPEAPNSRDVEDLFDAVIPRITLAEDWESAEDELLGLLSVSTELAWSMTNLWDEEPPTSFPSDRTFRDRTPQQLLEWYLEHTPKSHIRYDEEEKMIYINKDEETWIDRLRNWFDSTIPSWF